MPPVEALYYPAWDPPTKWLRSALLFFDKISVIVPNDAAPKYCEANLRMQDAMPEAFGELREVLFDPQLNKPQRNGLAAALDEIAKSPESSFSSMRQHKDTIELHYAKLTHSILYMLKDRKLIYEEQGDFLHTNYRAGCLILSLIADRYGTRKGLWTLTDDSLGYAVNVLGSRGPVAQAFAENQLAAAILSVSVPSEIENLTTEDYVELRKRYEMLRFKFQSAIQSISQRFHLNAIDDEKLLRDRIEECTSDFIKGIEEVRHSQLGMTVKQWKEFSIGTAVEIAAGLFNMVIPLGGVPIMAGLRLYKLTQVNQLQRNIGNANDAQRLLAGLQRELVSPSLFQRLQTGIRRRMRQA